MKMKYDIQPLEILLGSFYYLLHENVSQGSYKMKEH